MEYSASNSNEYLAEQPYIKPNPNYLSNLPVAYRHHRRNILASAHRKELLFRKSTSKSAPASCTYVWRLNALSLSYAEKMLLRRPEGGVATNEPDVILFMSRSQLEESFLGRLNKMGIKADWYAFTCQLNILRKAVLRKRTYEPGSYFNLIGVGECTSTGVRGQIMNYLRTLSRYRYDLSTVHGLQYSSSNHVGTHWSFNACGWSRSPALTCSLPSLDSKSRDYEPWIQHVFFLYDSLKYRVGKMASTETSHVKIWTIGGTRLKLLPFYAADGPGRMSGLSYLLSDDEQRIIGVSKKQWLNKTNKRLRESYLMKLAQTKCWISGLPFVMAENSTNIDIDTQLTISNSYTTREFSLLVMQSWGSPLNSCSDTIELLKVAYDAILGMSSLSLFGRSRF